MSKIGKYLRELSVVVVGIAITVSIGVWINNRNNEKDLRLFKKNAFEMFKLSGTMRLMKDKDLLFSIWDIYTGLDDLSAFIDIAHQHKLEEMKKELPMIAEGRTDFIPMITFYVATPWYHEMFRLCREASEELKTTVEKLEKRK